MSFNLGKYQSLTCDMGQLVPIGLFEVLPGDIFRHSTSALVRVSPLVAPLMHPVEVRIHHWFTPTRILWSSFEDFITGGPDGDDSSVFPKMRFATATQATIGSLADYLGIPPGFGTDAIPMDVSAIPFRAYANIFNEYYRDQDLQSLIAFVLTSGIDSTTSRALLRCCWEKDYRTSARPFTQKGPDVTIPIGTTAPVVSTGDDILLSNDEITDANMFVNNSPGPNLGAFPPNVIAADNAFFGSQTGLEADLASATGVDVNLLRLSLAIQRYRENRAKFGSRFTDYLLGAFRVRSSDARLQRPEYLGGGKNTITFSEVVQTGVTTDGDPEGPGVLRGHGITGSRTRGYRKYFEEHGYVMTLLSVRPKTVYAQGLDRHWIRTVKEEFFQPELAHIGQQEVYDKEVYAGSADPMHVFGWQDRYDELRRSESSVHGEFRDTLDYWNLARTFPSNPALNADFVECLPRKDILQAPSAHALQIMVNHRLRARRVVPKTGTSFIK